MGQTSFQALARPWCTSQTRSCSEDAHTSSGGKTANKHKEMSILGSSKGAKEISKAKKLDCDGGLGEGPLRRWRGRINPVKILGEEFPGMGRAETKSSSQDQGRDSAGTGRKQVWGDLASSARRGLTHNALGEMAPESHLVFKAITPSWGLHKSLTAPCSLNTGPHSFTFTHDNSLPLPAPSLLPCLWHLA